MNRMARIVLDPNRTYAGTRTAVQLCGSQHPECKPSLPGVDRFIRADAEKSYRSAEFLQYLHNFGYRLEQTLPRDKHANGIAERAVGVLSMKCNITMQPLGMTVPQKFWDLAFEYTCITHAFKNHSAIKTSPYHLITGKHVILKNLKAFWSLCCVRSRLYTACSNPVEDVSYAEEAT